jgi:hypothetical protein
MDKVSDDKSKIPKFLLRFKQAFLTDSLKSLSQFTIHVSRFTGS